MMCNPWECPTRVHLPSLTLQRSQPHHREYRRPTPGDRTTQHYVQTAPVKKRKEGVRAPQQQQQLSLCGQGGTPPRSSSTVFWEGAGLPPQQHLIFPHQKDTWPFWENLVCCMAYDWQGGETRRGSPPTAAAAAAARVVNFGQGKKHPPRSRSTISGVAYPPEAGEGAPRGKAGVTSAGWGGGPGYITWIIRVRRAGGAG